MQRLLSHSLPRSLMEWESYMLHVATSPINVSVNVDNATTSRVCTIRCKATILMLKPVPLFFASSLQEILAHATSYKNIAVRVHSQPLIGKPLQPPHGCGMPVEMVFPFTESLK